MREHQSSFTAQWVALCRALGALLPDEAQLAEDPFGARVTSVRLERLLALARAQPRLRPGLRLLIRPMLHFVAYMQVRTYLLDVVLRRFVASGGRQVVMLGAGFDARAHRFASELDGAIVFEVDHPATQRHKRALFGEARGVVYLPWDFERDPLDELPRRLAAVGHSPAQPTLTIWEGVTMYLTEPAIEATVAAVRDYSDPGSLLAFTYFHRQRITRPGWQTRAMSALVARVGEPFRFGWEAPELPAWLSARGFRLVSDQDVALAAARLLPPGFARLIKPARSDVAVAAPER
jgi:methyltransferase (TIGR00027 family)